MGTIGRVALAFPLLWLAAASGADVLETRDGRILEGIYLGGTQQGVRFAVDGQIEVHPRDEVLALTFVPGHGAAADAAPAPRAPAPARATTAPPPAPAPPPRAAATPTAPAPAPAATPAPAKLARVPAGTRLQVRMIDSIDARLAAVGDAFTATLENGLGVGGVAIVPGGSKLYGRVAELRDTGPAASRLKLELTGLLIQGQLLPLVTGSQPAAAPTPAAGAPDAATAPARPDVAAGTLLEFRLLQPFDLRLQ